MAIMECPLLLLAWIKLFIVSFLAYSHLNHGCLAGQYYIWVGRKKIILDQTPSLARSLGTFYTNHQSKMY